MALYGLVSVDDNTVTDSNGNGIPGVAVYIYLTGTEELASLFAGDSGGAKSNPLETDENGLFSAYVTPGFYDLRFVHPSKQEVWRRNVQVITSSDVPDSVRLITASDSVLISDLIVECDTALDNIIATMLAIASAPIGRQFGIVKRSADANIVTINDADGVQITTLGLLDEGVWISRNGQDQWKITGRF